MEANLTPRRVMIVNYNTLHCTDKNIAHSRIIGRVVFYNRRHIIRLATGLCEQNFRHKIIRQSL